MKKLFDKYTLLFLFIGAALILIETQILRWARNDGAIPAGIAAGMSVKQMLLVGAVLLLLSVFMVMVFRCRKERRTDLLIALSIAVFGIIIAALSPVLNGYDEHAHFFKTVATLDGKMFRYDSYNYPVSQSYITIRDHMLDRWYSGTFAGKWSRETQYVLAIENGFAQPTYPFYGYLFCAAGLGLGRLLGLSVGFSFLLGRIFNVLAYAGMVYCALRLLPASCSKYRSAITVVSCLPGALFVSSHYTQEGLVYGLILILAALFLRMKFGEGAHKKDCILFSVLFLLLVPLKYPYIFLGFLLFLIPEKNFGFRKSRLYIVILAAASILLAFLWFFFVSSQYTEPRVENVQGMEQLKYMMSHLPGFLLSAVTGFVQSIALYFSDNMRLFGSVFYFSSEAVGVIFGLCTMLVLCFLCGRYSLKSGERFLIALIIVFVILATEAALYVSYNPVGREGFIQGVQGRYFYGLLLFLPLLLPEKLQLASLPEERKQETAVYSFMVLQILWLLFGMTIFI